MNREQDKTAGSEVKMNLNAMRTEYKSQDLTVQVRQIYCLSNFEGLEPRSYGGIPKMV